MHRQHPTISMPTTDVLEPPAHMRRVITGHDASGKSIVLRDESNPPSIWGPEETGFRVYDLYRTDETPAQIDEELGAGGWADRISGNRELVSPNGSTLRVFDYRPGASVEMHRTPSIDYGIVLKGEVTLVLDGGETVIFKTGDVIIQRGTAHSWRNDTSGWTRVMFAVLPAQQIIIKGKPLVEQAVNL
ncbi:hypothetical protein BKA62DRAFT_712050 [Auriculariales sp. MPI-PUGE-AT-0066]|nr:hypothetical protein BKA62DRAFT_712050 [Auriculariales sp. MPI-PUGE-AT-0066]